MVLSTAATIAVLFGLFAAMVVLIRALDVFRDVRIARWTGQDPRRNADAVAEAAEQVAARRRHPSSGDGTTSEEA